LVSEGQFEFDISEVFSRPRVVPHARRAGWRGGFSLDIAHVDEVTGQAWNLTIPKSSGAALGAAEEEAIAVGDCITTVHDILILAEAAKIGDAS